MEFSKTFKSDIYTQIVVMLDTESGYVEGMVPVLVINFYFWLDNATHLLTLSFNNCEMGRSLRKQTFDGLTAESANSFVFDQVNRGSA